MVLIDKFIVIMLQLYLIVLLNLQFILHNFLPQLTFILPIFQPYFLLIIFPIKELHYH